MRSTNLLLLLLLLAWCIDRELTWRFNTVILFSLITVRTSGTTASLKMSLIRQWLRWNLAAATCFTEKLSSVSDNEYTGGGYRISGKGGGTASGKGHEGVRGGEGVSPSLLGSEKFCF